MSEIKETDLTAGPVKPASGKQWEWSIEFDKHLRSLLDYEGIEDPDVQMVVCEAFCALGLAEHRLFGEDTDTLESQEHQYTATRKMQKLVEEWIL